MKIKGTLSVTNKDWRFVYNSVLSYFNDEIKSAYLKACDYYSKYSSKSFNEANMQFETFILLNQVNKYQTHFIKSALFSGTNNKLYKPKKNNFKRINNRTEYLSAGVFNIHFNKSQNTISFETDSFSNLDDFIRTNTFISEFINMVNTINWPTRPGPNKTIKGCTLINIKDSQVEIFYKVGPNPPEYTPANNSSLIDTTIEEPKALQPEFIKNISMVSSSPDDTSQPIPVINPEMSEF